MRVLIVDDSMVMRRLVERALRQGGLELAEVVHASNGAEGLAVLEGLAAGGASLDLILCDVHMPVMEGLDFLLARQRQNLAPGVPVVMITADSSDPQVQKAMEVGAQGFISKPFTVEQVQERVASLLPVRVAGAGR